MTRRARSTTKWRRKTASRCKWCRGGAGTSRHRLLLTRHRFERPEPRPLLRCLQSLEGNLGTSGGAAVGIGHRADQTHRAIGAGVFCTLTRPVLFIARGGIERDTGVERAVSAFDEIEKPGIVRHQGPSIG